MKRSEMVKTLMGYLDGIDFSNCADNEELKDEAGYILNILEKHGMSPPAHIIETLNDVHYFPKRKVYEWESENE